MSGSGPAAPIFHGVWQSLQPATVTRYLPRAALSADAATVGLTASASRDIAGSTAANRVSSVVAATVSGRNFRADCNTFMAVDSGRDWSWIQRSSKASAALSTSCVPRGGICTRGSRERMRAVSTLVSGRPASISGAEAGRPGTR